MTTSGTYTFNPSLGEVVLNAYARIQVRRTEIEVSHMQDARMESNLLLAGPLGNLQPNLWTVDLQTVSLVQGTATYTVPAETIMILDAYISYGNPTIDRMIFPISRTEYASYPNKTQQGTPSVFWYDRLIAPTITLWSVPDGNSTYTLKYYRVRQIQDAEFTNAQTIEVPFLWLDAFTAGLAHRLSRIYAPQLEQIRKMDAEEAWSLAAKQGVENVPMMIVPSIGGYFR